MFDLILPTLVWSGLTVLVYRAAMALNRRWRHWATTPLLTSSIFLIFFLLTAGVKYADYRAGAHFLIMLIAPATVAFAVPIYEQRATIRKRWRILSIAVLTGSATAMVATWGLGWLFGIEPYLRLHMLPRNISMPFAMPIAETLGGQAELASVFVALTGTLGITLGDLVLSRLPRPSDTAFGAAYAACSHAAGAAKSQLQRGDEAGAVAGIVMIFIGLVNVFLAAGLSLMLK